MHFFPKIRSKMSNFLARWTKPGCIAIYGFEFLHPSGFLHRIRISPIFLGILWAMQKRTKKQQRIFNQIQWAPRDFFVHKNIIKLSQMWPKLKFTLLLKVFCLPEIENPQFFIYFTIFYIENLKIPIWGRFISDFKGKILFLNNSWISLLITCIY